MIIVSGNRTKRAVFFLNIPIWASIACNPIGWWPILPRMVVCYLVGGWIQKEEEVQSSSPPCLYSKSNWRCQLIRWSHSICQLSYFECDILMPFRYSIQHLYDSHRRITNCLLKKKNQWKVKYAYSTLNT